MATFDYGADTSIDPYAAYEWYGEHTFYAESDVILAYTVDLTNPAEDSRAVNAGSVREYVDGRFDKLFSSDSTWDVAAVVNFESPERVIFRMSPYIREALSLWNIKDLATHPDQAQLFAAVSLGDAKDYIDQNIQFAVDYLLGGLDDRVSGSISEQLPNELAQALEASLDTTLNGYAAGVIYPEVDKRIATAFDAVTESIGAAAALEVTAQLPLQIEQYVDAQLYPAVKGLAEEAATPLIEAKANEITKAYTAAIESALAGVGGDSWTQQQIEEIARTVVGPEVTEQVTKLLASDLPPVIAEEVTGQLNARLADEVAKTLDAALPGAVSTEVAGQVSSEVAAQLGTALDPTNLWNSIASLAGDAIQREVQAAVPALVSEETAKVVDALVANAIDATLGDKVANELDDALVAKLPELVQEQVQTNLNIALGEGGAIRTVIDDRVAIEAEQYMNEVVGPSLDQRIAEQVNAVATPLVESQLQQMLEGTLPGLVQFEVQNALQPELDTLVSVTVPNVVGVQLAEKLPDMVGAQIAERFGDSVIPESRRYQITQPTTLWVIEHNMGTVRFMERIYRSDGQPMFANVEVLSETSFVVRLTQAMTGWVDVEFFV